MCAQWSFKPACTFVQSDQKFHFQHFGEQRMQVFFMQTAKTLFRLRHYRLILVCWLHMSEGTLSHVAALMLITWKVQIMTTLLEYIAFPSRWVFLEYFFRCAIIQKSKTIWAASREKGSSSQSFSAHAWLLSKATSCSLAEVSFWHTTYLREEHRFWPQGYKSFFMLNSSEHEICPANKSQITNNCKFFLVKHSWAWKFLC